MQFDVEAPDGRIFTLEGDSEPTEQQLSEIYSSLASNLQTASDSLEVNPNTVKYSDIQEQRIAAGTKVRDYLKGVFNFSINKEGIKEKEGSYWDRLTTFEVKKTDAKPEGVQVAEEAYEAFKDMPSKVTASEVAKSFSRAGLGFTASMGDGARALGDFMVETKALPENKFRRAVGSMLYKFGDLVKAASEKGLESKLLELNEDIYAGSFEENPSVMRIVDFLSEASPSIAMGYGIGGVMKMPNVAAAVMTLGDTSEVYWGAKAAGKSADEAMKLYATSTGLSWGAERYGLEHLVGNGAKSIAKGTLMEAGTEMLQQGIAINLVKKLGYDDTVDVYEGVLQAGILGAVGGHVVGTMSAAGRVYDRVKSKLTGKGYTESQAEEIITGVAQHWAENADAIDNNLGKVAQKNLSIVEGILNKLPTEKKAQYEQEFRKNTEQYLGEITRAMPDWDFQRAKDVADILSSSTYAYAILNNVSPAQAKNVKFVKENEQKFLDRMQGKTDEIPFQIAGVKSKLANQQKLSEAQEMIDNGFTPDEVFEKTGWYKYLNRWLYEIDDTNAKVKQVRKTDTQFNIDGKPTTGKIYKLGEVLDFPELYASYPEMQNVVVAEYDFGTDDSYGGVNLEGTQMHINTRMKKTDFLKTLLHESAHLIQIKEDLPIGSDKTGIEYTNSAGEAQAQDVENRSELSISERVKNLPFTPDENTFILFKDGSVIPMRNKPTIHQQGNKGAYIDGTIYLFEGADVSTIMHEFFHHWGESLKKMNTPESKRLLANINKWADSEFNRKYKVVEVGNKFKVVDKNNRDVYTNNGNRFDTAEVAKSYAMDEIFAQGVEQYLSTGESQSGYLKRAFDHFINYMKDIYAKTNALDIELTPEMKQIYADLLGASSVDALMNNDIEGFIADRIANQEQIDVKQQEIQDDALKDVHFQDAKSVKAYESTALDRVKDRHTHTWIGKSLLTMSSRARRLSPRLLSKLRRYYYDILAVRNRYYDKVQPFFEALRTIEHTNKNDFEQLDLALKNSNKKVIREIMEKHGKFDTILALDEVLDEIYAEAKSVGIEVDYRKDFYPRLVKDYKGFIQYTSGERYSAMNNALRKIERETGAKLSKQERAEWINNNLRRQKNNDILKGANHKMGRTVETVDGEMNQFYAKTSDALIQYIDGMVQNIQTAKLLGLNEEIDQNSIGMFVQDMIEDGEISENETDEAIEVIKHSIANKPITGKLAKAFRDAGYLTTMGQFSTALTQMDDFSSAWLNAGFVRAVKAAFASKGVTIKDANIDSIADEFRTVEGLSKAVNELFKLTGMTKVDAFMKETFLNSDFKRMQDMSVSELTDEIETLFETREEARRVAEDIKNGVKNEDTMFVSWNNLSNYQPLSRLEMPEYYEGDSRFWYALKSFTLKRIDIGVQQYDRIARGKTLAEKGRGAWGMLRIAAVLLLCGMSKDKVIDLFYGRKTDIKDSVIDNLYGLIGINKYFAWKVREEGAFEGVSSLLFNIPAGNIVSSFHKDIKLYNTRDKEGKRKRKLANFDTFKYVPLVGSLYYWRAGRGKEKQLRQEGKLKKQKRY